LGPDEIDAVFHQRSPAFQRRLMIGSSCALKLIKYLTSAPAALVLKSQGLDPKLG